MARLARVEVFASDEIAIVHVMICPVRRDADRRPEEPNEFELNAIRNNPAKLKAIRSRLSDISWWMRLLDETAILACAAYVDLNPVRAAMAETIEESDYTSAQQRALELKAEAGEECSLRDSPASSTGEKGAFPKPISKSLSPVFVNERTSEIGPCLNKSHDRASDKGFLPMSVAAYLELLDWTARQLRSDKRGAPPASAKPIFERLGIDDDTWLELTKDFGRLFTSVAGKPKIIDETRSRERHQRYKIQHRTRELLPS
jgi:hypothetical protein